jgi:hypothetical protein
MDMTHLAPTFGRRTPRGNPGLARVRSVVVVITAASAIVAAQPTPDLTPFAPPQHVDVGNRSGDIALVDVDRDGHLDLVSAHPPDPVVAVRRGDGRGSFTPAPSSRVTVPRGVAAFAVGDVDGDGAADLVVANKDDSREFVELLRGDGRGGFRAASGPPFVIGAAMAYYKPSLRLIDINEDGRVDIVSANGRRNRVDLLVADGRGSYRAGPSVTLDEPGDVSTFGMADVDQDGHHDLVFTSRAAGGDRLSLKRGDGTGAFGSSVVLVPTSPRPRVAALADVNGDGHVDVVVAHAEIPLLSVFVNSGTGALVPAAASPYTLAAEAFDVAVADINRDGRPDLVSMIVNSQVAPYDSAVSALVGDGRSFTPAPGSPFPVERGAYNLAIGDLNGDRRTDVASSSFEGKRITLLLGRESSSVPDAGRGSITIGAATFAWRPRSDWVGSPTAALCLCFLRTHSRVTWAQVAIARAREWSATSRRLTGLRSAPCRALR